MLVYAAYLCSPPQQILSRAYVAKVGMCMGVWEYGRKKPSPIPTTYKREAKAELYEWMHASVIYRTEQ